MAKKAEEKPEEYVEEYSQFKAKIEALKRLALQNLIFSLIQ